SSYADVTLKALDRGLINTEEELTTHLERLKTAKLWDGYADVTLKALDRGLIDPPETKTNIDLALQRLKIAEWWSSYTDVTLKALDRGLINTTETKTNIDCVLQGLKIAERWSSYADVTLKALDRGLIDPPEAKTIIDLVLQRLKIAEWWSSYADVTLKALDIELIDTTEMKTNIDLALQGLKIAEQWSSYADVTLKALDIGLMSYDPSYIKYIRDLASQKGLPAVYLAKLIQLSSAGGISADGRFSLEEEARDLLAGIEEADEGVERDDQRIDYKANIYYLAAGLASFQYVSQKTAKQAVLNFIERGYLPLLLDTMVIFSKVEIGFAVVLREFINNTGTKYINNPSLLANLAAYADVYNILGLSEDIFGEDLHKGSEEEIIAALGERVVKTLSEKLSMEVDIDNADLEHVLSGWELEYLGALISAKSAWDDEDTKYFGLILKFALEGKFYGLIYPESYGLINENSYPDDMKDAIRRVRLHSSNILRLIKERGIITDKWAHPEKYAPARLTHPGAALRRTNVDILKDFGNFYGAFKDWFDIWDKNPEFEEKFIRAEKSLGPWIQLLGSSEQQIHNKQGILQQVNNLKKIMALITSMQETLPQGEVPEPVADLYRIIQEISDLQNTPKTGPPDTKRYRMRFWERVPGRDVFLGNMAKSCASLGENSRAIFEFLLDMGTHYVVIEDLKGKAKGYARMFLAEGTDGELSIFIDSIDGIVAYEYQEMVIQYIKDYAKEYLNILPERVLSRELNKISAKTGDALTEKYFHHSGITIGKSEPTEEDELVYLHTIDLDSVIISFSKVLQSLGLTTSEITQQDINRFKADLWNRAKTSIAGRLAVLLLAFKSLDAVAETLAVSAPGAVLDAGRELSAGFSWSAVLLGAGIVLFTAGVILALFLAEREEYAPSRRGFLTSAAAITVGAGLVFAGRSPVLKLLGRIEEFLKVDNFVEFPAVDSEKDLAELMGKVAGEHYQREVGGYWYKANDGKCYLGIQRMGGVSSVGYTQPPAEIMDRKKKGEIEEVGVFHSHSEDVLPVPSNSDVLNVFEYPSLPSYIALTPGYVLKLKLEDGWKENPYVKIFMEVGRRVDAYVKENEALYTAKERILLRIMLKREYLDHILEEYILKYLRRKEEDHPDRYFYGPRNQGLNADSFIVIAENFLSIDCTEYDHFLPEGMIPPRKSYLEEPEYHRDYVLALGDEALVSFMKSSMDSFVDGLTGDYSSVEGARTEYALIMGVDGILRVSEKENTLYVVFNNWAGEVVNIYSDEKSASKYRGSENNPNGFRVVEIDVPQDVYRGTHVLSLISARATADNVKLGDRVLVLGTGMGLEAYIAVEKGAIVDAVDINSDALRSTQDLCGKIAPKNRGELRTFLYDIMPGGVREGELAEKYDHIIFNMPHYAEAGVGKEKEVTAVKDPGGQLLAPTANIVREHLVAGGKAILVNSERYFLREEIEEETGLPVFRDALYGKNPSMAYVIENRKDAVLGDIMDVFGASDERNYRLVKQFIVLADLIRRKQFEAKGIAIAEVIESDLNGISFQIPDIIDRAKRMKGATLGLMGMGGGAPTAEVAEEVLLRSDTEGLFETLVPVALDPMYVNQDLSTGELIALAESYRRRATRESVLMGGDIGMQVLNKITDDVQEIGLPVDLSGLVPVMRDFEKEAYDESGAVKRLSEYLSSHPVFTSDILGQLEACLDVVNNMNERTELSVRIMRHQPRHPNIFGGLGQQFVLALARAFAGCEDNAEVRRVKDSLYNIVRTGSSLNRVVYQRIYARKDDEYSAELPNLSVSEAAEWRRVLNQLNSYSENKVFAEALGRDVKLEKNYSEITAVITENLVPLCNGKIVREEFEVRPVVEKGVAEVIKTLHDVGVRGVSEKSVEVMIDEATLIANRHLFEEAIKTLVLNSIQVAVEKLAEDGLSLVDGAVQIKIMISRRQDGEILVQVVEFNDNVGGVSDESLLQETRPGSGRQRMTVLNFSRRKNDTGFGLAYVYHAIALHGGELWIRNIDDKPGEGMVATMLIPPVPAKPASAAEDTGIVGAMHEEEGAAKEMGIHSYFTNDPVGKNIPRETIKGSLTTTGEGGLTFGFAGPAGQAQLDRLTNDFELSAREKLASGNRTFVIYDIGPGEGDELVAVLTRLDAAVG
ncbi:MAG: hypothetical protein P9L88_03145, partial [Candidatus Tantalella remota]|nr:hypothetical protein [Candidatus Tantalella remota]